MPEAKRKCYNFKFPNGMLQISWNMSENNNILTQQNSVI